MTIEIENLDFAYGDLPVLAGVTCSARAGRMTALIGPNAAGKSTLLRCAIGAGRPLRGSVRVGGVRACRLRGRRLATRIAYVAQRSTVAAAFTVREVVALGRHALGADGARVEAALDRLQLRAIADRPYPALSVGQQQRVAIARALAQLEPGAAFVLDEPTAAMDLAHARDCFSLLRELADDGMVVLVALHDLAAAAAVADDVWVLAPGADGEPSRLRAAGAVGSVMEVDLLRAVFGVRFEWVERAGGKRVLLPDTSPVARSGRMEPI